MATTLRQQVSTLKLIVMALSIVLILCVLYYYQIRQSTSESQKKDDKVCLRLSDYNKLLQSPGQQQQRVTLSSSNATINPASDRDIRVLKDPLFPAINRSETDTHNRTIDAINRKQLYTRTQDFTDRYRMVAYVTNPDDKKDSGGNVWNPTWWDKGYSHRVSKV
jgi:hypothetical protein